MAPLEAYCIGLMLPCERKSVEPMAAITAPERVSAQHQSMLHFISQGAWSDAAVLGKVREMVVPEMERHGPIEAWIIDNTGIPKQGKHSVGVARQYCGQLGKQDNCQVAVMLSLANHHASLPVAYRLYLPKEWVNDAARCCKAGVPDEIGFMTKPEIALEQIRWAHKAGLAPRGGVDGRRLRGEHRAALEHRGARLDIRCRYFAEHCCVGKGRRTVAAKAILGPRATGEGDAARRGASADLGQGCGAQSARKRVAQGHMA